MVWGPDGFYRTGHNETGGTCPRCFHTCNKCDSVAWQTNLDIFGWSLVPQKLRTWWHFFLCCSWFLDVSKESCWVIRLGRCVHRVQKLHVLGLHMELAIWESWVPAQLALGSPRFTLLRLSGPGIWHPTQSATTSALLATGNVGQKRLVARASCLAVLRDHDGTMVALLQNLDFPLPTFDPGCFEVMFRQLHGMQQRRSVRGWVAKQWDHLWCPIALPSWKLLSFFCHFQVRSLPEWILFGHLKFNVQERMPEPCWDDLKKSLCFSVQAAIPCRFSKVQMDFGARSQIQRWKLDASWRRAWG